MNRSQRINRARPNGRNLKASVAEKARRNDEPREVAQNLHGLEGLLDEYEFSRVTGRSVASARRDRLFGQGCPFVKLLGLVRYRPSDIRTFIENNLHGEFTREAR